MRLQARSYSGLTPAILTIFAYLGTPSRTIAASSAGELVTGSAPALLSASRVSAAHVRQHRRHAAEQDLHLAADHRGAGGTVAVVGDVQHVGVPQ